MGAPGLTGGGPARDALRAAMAAHQAGRLVEADAAYAAALAAEPDQLQALRLRGILKRELGDYTASASLLRRAAERSPAPGEALAELALTHLAAGDLELAEAGLRQACQRGGSGRALANLGAVLQYRGHLAEAEAVYREYLGNTPDDSEIRANLVATLLDAGRGEAALAECEAGEAALPGDPALAAARGAALLALGQPAAAASILRDVLARAPDDELAAVNLAVALAETMEFAAARTVLETTVARSPANARAVADLMSLRAGDGEPGAAVSLGRTFLARFPGERLVVAALAYALWDAREDAAALRLLGLAGEDALLVQHFGAGELESPAVPDHAAIAARLATDPTLVAAPLSKSTRGGGQTGEFHLHREPVLAPLDRLFRAAAARYAERLRAAGYGDDPALAGFRDAFTLRAWGTVLPAGGRQLPHQHPLGCLSAVYYVAMPNGMSGDAGALELGAPPGRYRFRRPVPSRLIQPRAGELVMFPSYLYHATRPFAGAGLRVSVAVDLMPRR